MFKLGAMLKIVDKAWGNHSHYYTNGFGLTFDCFTYENHGYIKGWEFSSDSDTVGGKTVDEFLDVLREYLANYKFQNTEHMCEKMVIYTDNILAIYGFVKPFTSDAFYQNKVKLLNFTLLDHFEIRTILPFIDKAEDIRKDLNLDDSVSLSRAMAIYAQKLIDEVFVPERHFYITPYQRQKHRIKKAYKASKSNVVKELTPVDYSGFKYLRLAYFAGLCYCPWPKKTFDVEKGDEYILSADRISAYIYDFVVEKHCMGGHTRVDPSTWEYYLESEKKASIGTYRITYSLKSQKINCIKDTNEKNVKTGLHITDEFVLCNIDLKNFMSVATIEDIECISLREYKYGYLPKEIVDVFIQDYIKKEELKNDLAFRLSQQKKLLNSNYGNSMRKVYGETDEEKEKNYTQYKKDLAMAPQWGIFCCAYGRQKLLELGNSLTVWAYSDTDCARCAYTEENVKKIEEYNDRLRAKTKKFCEHFGYDYEKLKDLGTFRIEKVFKKFKANAKKQYMYTDVDGNFELVASGFDKEDKDIGEWLYDEEELDFGTTTFSRRSEEPSEIEINGVKYVSPYGSYYQEKKNFNFESMIEWMLLLENFM